MNRTDDLLHEAIEGHIVPGPAHTRTADLARMAAKTRRLRVPGPDAEAVARMTARFERMVEGRRMSGTGAWVLGWLGIGSRPRAAVQRLAAGALLLVATTTTAGVATGHTPLETASGIAGFAANAVVNLDPRGDNQTSNAQPPQDSPGVAGTTPTPAPTVGGGAPATGTPTATPTVETPVPTAAGGVPVSPGRKATEPPAAAPSPDTPTPGRQVTATPTGTPTATPTPKPTGTPEPPSGSDPSTPPAGSPTASATPSPSPSPAPSPTPAPDTTVSAGDAGTVTLRIAGNTLRVVSMQLNPGWSAGTPQEDGPQVQIEFKSGDHKVEFKAVLQAGQIKVTAHDD